MIDNVLKLYNLFYRPRNIDRIFAASPTSSYATANVDFNAAAAVGIQVLTISLVRNGKKYLIIVDKKNPQHSASATIPSISFFCAQLFVFRRSSYVNILKGQLQYEYMYSIFFLSIRWFKMNWVTLC